MKKLLLFTCVILLTGSMHAGPKRMRHRDQIDAEINALVAALNEGHVSPTDNIMEAIGRVNSAIAAKNQAIQELKAQREKDDADTGCLLATSFCITSIGCFFLGLLAHPYFLYEDKS